MLVVSLVFWMLKQTIRFTCLFERTCLFSNVLKIVEHSMLMWILFFILFACDKTLSWVQLAAKLKGIFVAARLTLTKCSWFDAGWALHRSFFSFRAFLFETGFAPLDPHRLMKHLLKDVSQTGSTTSETGRTVFFTFFKQTFFSFFLRLCPLLFSVLYS